ncbi:MAG: hypothetical protein OIF57_15565 [Marinobacterium sp.]|nr:hypothetical protein [Marinobacterium sp.]
MNGHPPLLALILILMALNGCEPMLSVKAEAQVAMVATVWLPSMHSVGVSL